MTVPPCPVCGAASTMQTRVEAKARHYRTVCVNLCLRGDWAGTPHTAERLYALAVNEYAAQVRRRKALAGRCGQ